MKISVSVIMFTDTTVLLVSRSFRGRCLKQSSPNYKRSGEEQNTGTKKGSNEHLAD